MASGPAETAPGAEFELGPGRRKQLSVTRRLRLLVCRCTGPVGGPLIRERRAHERPCGSPTSARRAGADLRRELLAGLLAGAERIMRKGDEVEPVPTVVANLDERLVAVGFDNGSDRSGGPAARIDSELNHI